MNISCEIKIDFRDEKQAKTVLKSIEIDNFDFVKSKTLGKEFIANIKSNSVSSLIHTIDDLLACMSVALKVLDKN